jgi:D-alanine-D-alanine ligase-like ATP-grasp enzyme
VADPLVAVLHAPGLPRAAASGRRAETGSNPRDERHDEASALRVVAALKGLGLRAIAIPVDGDLDLTLRALEPATVRGRGSPSVWVWPALHGRAGGRGAVQLLAEQRGFPVLGPSAAAVGLAFDKLRARQMLAFHNVPVPATVELAADAAPDLTAVARLGPEVVVKPRRGAASAGVSWVSCPSRLHEALDLAGEVDAETLIERAMPDATEVQVTLLHGEVVGAIELRPLPHPRERARDGAGSFAPSRPAAADLVAPPELSPLRQRGVERLAQRAADCLGLRRGIVRVDLLVSDRWNEVVLEVEPLPPLHPAGAVARTAQAAGLGIGGLVEAVVRDAFEPGFRFDRARTWFASTPSPVRPA